MTRNDIVDHQRRLSQCRACPDMIPPVIIGQPVASEILLIGQAPGEREGALGRPFAWTAGKTLFKWFETIGIGEDEFRTRVYMTAVCRCFPGKNPQGGDRVPSRDEVERCSKWLRGELQLLKPRLVIPVGKLAISQYIGFDRLVDVIGQHFTMTIDGVDTELIPLPHPSGASTWHRMSPGKELLEQALERIAQHESWQRLLEDI